jgi:hypothetical protein
MFGMFDSPNVKVAKNCSKIINAMSSDTRAHHEQAFTIIYAGFIEEFRGDFIEKWIILPTPAKEAYKDKLSSTMRKLARDPTVSQMCFAQMAVFFGFFLNFLDEKDRVAGKIMGDNLAKLGSLARSMHPNFPF